MILEILTDAVARRAAETIAEAARAAVQARGRFTVAISGGRTPWTMLRMLSGLARQLSSTAKIHQGRGASP